METRFTTGKVRLSYVHLLEPSAIEAGQDPKYSVSIIIRKDDKETLAKYKAALQAVKSDEKFKAKMGGKIPAVLKEPLRDGDTERPDDEAYAGCYFLNASSKRQPGIVDRYKKVTNDPDQVYSGVYGHVSLNLYGFNTSGNKGVAAGLGSVLVLGEGEPLGYTENPEEAFAEVNYSENLDDWLD